MSTASEVVRIEDGANLAVPPASWFAVLTRSRHEKKVADELQKREFVTFLPLAKQVHRWSDRRKCVEVPLFPGYAFVRIAFSPQTRVAVLRVSGIVSFVGSHNLGTPIPDSQIDDIRALLANEIPFKSHSFLTVGQRVRIHGGALDGLQGILTATTGNRRLVVSIEPIQRSISIDLDGYEVEPL